MTRSFPSISSRGGRKPVSLHAETRHVCRPEGLLQNRWPVADLPFDKLGGSLRPALARRDAGLAWESGSLQRSILPALTGLRRQPVDDLAEVVHDAVECPVGLGSLQTCSGEPGEVPVVLAVAEDGFNGGPTPPVGLLSFASFEPSLHRLAPARSARRPSAPPRRSPPASTG